MGKSETVSSHKKRLKILFVTPWYPSREAPAGMFVQELARAAQLHNDVIVLHHAGKRRDLPGIWYIEQEHDQSLTKGIPLYRFWYRESPVPETSFMLFGMWSLLQAFRYLVKQGHQPHIIHVHVYAFGALAVLLGKIYGLPVVITEHSTAFPRGFLNLRQKLLAQFAFGWAGLVLPVSEALRKAIEDNGIKGRFRVVPNVVDTDIFYPHQSIASDGKSKQILFVGFLDKFHRKGIPNLLEALGQIYHRRNDWHLDIVGDGPARSEYEQLVSSLGLTGNVTFYGNRYKQEVAEFMSHCDFFVLPSMFETFSVVLIEALASGKPVIATSSGGPEEFVTKEVGILIPPKDSATLEAAIDYMLDHYHSYSAAQLAGYVQQRFSYDAVGLMLDDIYHNLNSSKGK